jgi:hypothetical protein
MALRLTKPFQPLTEENAAALPGQLGVYELADASGKTVAFGFAGARSLFGLRSELTAAAKTRPHGATQFRVEVNQQYHTRFRELLMVHQADHGSLPPLNAEDPPINLGRLSPL